MGLLDKKFCDICGEKIGLLGNRKLEDGNLCKDCANKLSPWFSGRKKSTVEQIKAQLNYREANRAAVEAFNVSRTLGDNYKVIFDDAAQKFLVTASSNWRNTNPDVISLSQVTGVDTSIDEDQVEMMTKDAEGNEVSYNPQVYSHEYDFYLTIYLRHDYFDEIKIKLNGSSVEEKPDIIPGRVRPDGQLLPPIVSYPEAHGQDYERYEEMLCEIKCALTGEAFVPRTETPAPQPAPQPQPARLQVKCPHCGAITFIGNDGCCEFCGLRL